MSVLFLKTIVSVSCVQCEWCVKLTLDYDAGQICTLIIMGTFMPFPFFLSVGINSFLNIDDCYCGKGACRRILSGVKSGKGTSINHSDHHK